LSLLQASNVFSVHAQGIILESNVMSLTHRLIANNSVVIVKPV